MTVYQIRKQRLTITLVLNTLAIVALGLLLNSPLNQDKLLELRTGISIERFHQVFGTPVTDQGYRVGALMVGCFSYGVNFDSDNEGFRGPGGPWRDGYLLTPKSSWSISYRVDELPKDRPSAVNNSLLKVWVIKDQSFWVWQDRSGLVTHMIEMPICTTGGVQEKFEQLSAYYKIYGWKGVVHAIAR